MTAGNPESHLERVLSDPDDLESSEIFFLRANSLEIALRGLAATHEPGLDPTEYAERQAAAAVIITDTKVFFDDLKSSDFRCIYQAGAKPVNIHLLRPLGHERALFESGLIEPRSRFEMDYAEFHNVPQDAPRDMPHGHASQLQLYVGSTRSELAISAHQLSLSFLNGGGWELGYRAMP